MTSIPDLMAKAADKEQRLLSFVELAAARLHDTQKKPYLEAKIEVLDDLIRSVHWRT